MPFGLFAQIVRQSIVVVPARVVNLDEPHSAFDQPPSHQALPPHGRVSIQLTNANRLASDVESVGRLSLHAVSQFKRLDPGLKSWVVGPLGGMTPVEVVQEVELEPLLCRGCERAMDILEQACDV